MNPFGTINLSDVDTKLPFFHRQHVPEASLNQLVDVDDLKKTGIIVCIVTQCTITPMFQVFFMNKKMCLHQYNTSYLPPMAF